MIKLKEDDYQEEDSDQGGEEAGDRGGRRRITRKWMTKIRNRAVKLKKEDH